MYSKDFENASKEALATLHEWEVSKFYYDWDNRMPVDERIEEKLYETMDEYGEDHGLPEGWWEDEGDAYDIFAFIDEVEIHDLY